MPCATGSRSSPGPARRHDHDLPLGVLRRARGALVCRPAPRRVIDGRFEVLDGAEPLVVEKPAAEEQLAVVPALSARVADGRWSRLNPGEQEAVPVPLVRASALRRLVALVEEHVDELAWLEVIWMIRSG